MINDEKINIYQHKNILLRFKHFLNKSSNLAAPGSYDIEKSEKVIHQSSGAITFGIKYKEQKPDDTPGINPFFQFIQIYSLCLVPH